MLKCFQHTNNRSINCHETLFTTNHNNLRNRADHSLIITRKITNMASSSDGLQSYRWVQTLWFPRKSRNLLNYGYFCVIDKLQHLRWERRRIQMWELEVWFPEMLIVVLEPTAVMYDRLSSPTFYHSGQLAWNQTFLFYSYFIFIYSVCFRAKLPTNSLFKLLCNYWI